MHEISPSLADGWFSGITQFDTIHKNEGFQRGNFTSSAGQLHVFGMFLIERR